MARLMRVLTHPGPVSARRLIPLPCRAQAVTLPLRAGLAVDRAAAAAFAEAGFQAGYLRLAALPLSALAWVIPARAAPGNPCVAWFSDTRRAAGGTIIAGGLHLGARDSQPFVHCHGLWRDPDGALYAGHLRADETVLAQDCTAQGWGLSGARFEVQHDPETGFPLFTPQPFGAMGPGEPATLLRLCPNQDLSRALDGLPDGTRIEGIGSLIGTRFDDAPPIDGPATEIWLREGRIAQGAARLRAVSVGMDGTAQQGWLSRDANAVCVTAELLILPA